MPLRAATGEDGEVVPHKIPHRVSRRGRIGQHRPKLEAVHHAPRARPERPGPLQRPDREGSEHLPTAPIMGDFVQDLRMAAALELERIRAHDDAAQHALHLCQKYRW